MNDHQWSFPSLLTRGTRVAVRVGPEELARVAASPVLAVLPRVLGGVVSLSKQETAAGATASESKTQKQIGVVHVMGPLAQRAHLDDTCAYVDGYDAITARMELALEEPKNEGVLLVIDSPGGDVPGLDEAAKRMRASVERSGKSVVAYVDGLAASAAYRIAAVVADEIVVPESGEVGSIGTLGARVDLTENQAKAGIKWTIARYPAGKAESHPLAPLNDLADERLNADVEMHGKRFMKAISKARDIKTSEIKAMNGALYMGAKAVEMRLADRVGSLESAASAVLGDKGKTKYRRGGKGESMSLIKLVAARLELAEDVSGADAAEALEKHFDSQDEKIEALKAKVAASDKLEAELKALREEKESAAKNAAVDAAIQAGVDAGKVTPAKAKSLRDKGAKHGAEWVTSTIEELPVLAATLPATRPADTSAKGADPVAELSERELAMCAEDGTDPKEYAARKAAFIARKAR